MRSTVGVGDPDNDVSQDGRDKMHEICGGNRNGKGVTHGSRDRTQQELKHSYLHWSSRAFVR